MSFERNPVSRLFPSIGPRHGSTKERLESTVYDLHPDVHARVAATDIQALISRSTRTGVRASRFPPMRSMLPDKCILITPH